MSKSNRSQPLIQPKVIDQVIQPKVIDQDKAKLQIIDAFLNEQDRNPPLMRPIKFPLYR